MIICDKCSHPQCPVDGWVKCEVELPPMGMPVIAICADGPSEVIPHVVYRTNYDEGWAWNVFRGDDYYSPNSAYFNYWMPIPPLPELPQ